MACAARGETQICFETDGLRLEIGYASAAACETRGREGSGISTLQCAPIRPRLRLAVPVRRAHGRGKIQIPAEDRWKMQREAERPLKRAERACWSGRQAANGGGAGLGARQREASWACLTVLSDLGRLAA